MTAGGLGGVTPAETGVAGGQAGGRQEAGRMVDEVCFYCRQTEGVESCQDCGLVAVCADSHHWALHRWADIRQEISSISGNISDLTESVCPSQ